MKRVLAKCFSRKSFGSSDPPLPNPKWPVSSTSFTYSDELFNLPQVGAFKQVNDYTFDKAVCSPAKQQIGHRAKCVGSNQETSYRHNLTSASLQSFCWAIPNATTFPTTNQGQRMGFSINSSNSLTVKKIHQFKATSQLGGISSLFCCWYLLARVQQRSCNSSLLMLTMTVMTISQFSCWPRLYSSSMRWSPNRYPWESNRLKFSPLEALGKTLAESLLGLNKTHQIPFDYSLLNWLAIHWFTQLTHSGIRLGISLWLMLRSLFLDLFVLQLNFGQSSTARNSSMAWIHWSLQELCQSQWAAIGFCFQLWLKLQFGSLKEVKTASLTWSNLLWPWYRNCWSKEPHFSFPSSCLKWCLVQSVMLRFRRGSFLQRAAFL